MTEIKNDPASNDAESIRRSANDDLDLAKAASKFIGKSVWTGAAVGIGSAAIVAALLYARKRS